MKASLKYGITTLLFLIYTLQGLKALIALVVVAVVVPLMVGVLMELVIVIPLRVPLHQTPILFLWQVRECWE